MNDKSVFALLMCLVGQFPMLSLGADSEDYKIDLEGPVHLTELPPRIMMPTRVEVYVVGPKIGHDKSWFASLLHKRPAYSSTNYAEIKNLVSVLQINDNKERVKNSTKHMGYTYHVLLFQEVDHTVMHFRVLEFTDVKTDWYDVWPRSRLGFGYFNKPIGPWLHDHVPIAMTNAPSSEPN